MGMEGVYLPEAWIALLTLTALEIVTVEMINIRVRKKLPVPVRLHKPSTVEETRE
jgi:hypothetical protein